MRIVKIGRSSHNDVVINDDHVSSSHCQIIQDDRGGVTLIDTNSTNGTYVNGVRRQGEVRLNPSDIVRIGHTTLPWQTYFNNAPGPVPGPVPHSYGTTSKPDNNLVPAILATFLLSLVFGIVSWVFAAKVDKLWDAGDYDGAIDAAKKSKTWFWVALGVGVFQYLCIFIASM